MSRRCWCCSTRRAATCVSSRADPPIPNGAGRQAFHRGLALQRILKTPVISRSESCAMPATRPATRALTELFMLRAIEPVHGSPASHLPLIGRAAGGRH